MLVLVRHSGIMRDADTEGSGKVEFIEGGKGEQSSQARRGPKWVAEEELEVRGFSSSSWSNGLAF